MTGANARSSLLFRIDRALLAIPLASVVEILRPLPLEVVPSAPAIAAGLAVVRGTPIVVISARRLFGAAPGEATRFVIIAVGARRVGLAVDSVVGLRLLEPESLSALPSMMSRAIPAAEVIGALDGELLAVLETSHLVPEDVLAAMDNLRVAS